MNVVRKLEAGGKPSTGWHLPHSLSESWGVSFGASWTISNASWGGLGVVLGDLGVSLDKSGTRRAATNLWGPKGAEKGLRFGHPATGESEGKVVGQSVLIQIWAREKVLKRDLVFGVLLRRLAKGRWLDKVCCDECVDAKKR